MAKYPENSSIPFENPEAIALRFKTLMSKFDDLGEEKRRQKWLYTKRNIGPLRYAWLTKADARTLWQFYLDRKGAYESFNFFLPNVDTYEGEYVGTGDGSQTVWNLPCKSSSGRTLKLDGVSQSEGVDYTFSAGGGTDGADKITMTAAPTDGSRLTLDFTGTLKVCCRFMEDELSYERFYDVLTNIGLRLKGKLNE